LTGAQTNATVLSGAEVIKFTRMPDGSENLEAQIKPLAYTGSERFEQLSQLPTMKELGYDMEFCIKSWWFAPKGTPKAAIEGFSSALQASTSTDRYQKFLESKGFANLFLGGNDLQQDLQNTWTAIEPVAKLASKK
jgi:tripartite-type tricarboxylate transporter receptor subunit TctC